MRGKSSLLRGLFSGAVYIQRKRSERFCPNDLVSLDSKCGQINRVQPRSGRGPHVLAAWVRKFPRSRRSKLTQPTTQGRGGLRPPLAIIFSRPNFASHDTRS